MRMAETGPPLWSLSSSACLRHLQDQMFLSSLHLPQHCVRCLNQNVSIKVERHITISYSCNLPDIITVSYSSRFPSIITLPIPRPSAPTVFPFSWHQWRDDSLWNMVVTEGTILVVFAFLLGLGLGLEPHYSCWQTVKPRKNLLPMLNTPPVICFTHYSWAAQSHLSINQLPCLTRSFRKIPRTSRVSAPMTKLGYIAQEQP